MCLWELCNKPTNRSPRLLPNEGPQVLPSVTTPDRQSACGQARCTINRNSSSHEGCVWHMKCFRSSRNVRVFCEVLIKTHKQKPAVASRWGACRCCHLSPRQTAGLHVGGTLQNELKGGGTIFLQNMDTCITMLQDLSSCASYVIADQQICLVVP